jgi:hypothetical protein
MYWCQCDYSVACNFVIRMQIPIKKLRNTLIIKQNLQKHYLYYIETSLIFACFDECLVALTEG